MGLCILLFFLLRNKKLESRSIPSQTMGLCKFVSYGLINKSWKVGQSPHQNMVMRGDILSPNSRVPRLFQMSKNNTKMDEIFGQLCVAKYVLMNISSLCTVVQSLIAFQRRVSQTHKDRSKDQRLLTSYINFSKKMR